MVPYIIYLSILRHDSLTLPSKSGVFQVPKIEAVSSLKPNMDRDTWQHVFGLGSARVVVHNIHRK